MKKEETYYCKICNVPHVRNSELGKDHYSKKSRAHRNLIDKAQKDCQNIFDEVSKVIVGQKHVLEEIIISILCDGSALLEGYPGMAKTLMVKTISDVMDLKFSRIQNTPDLMPSDITGTYIIKETKNQKTFEFYQGPIFANVVLADEINRTSPKTQSAYLEAMQEKQVTAGNKTYKLPQPFFVLATQNPIDVEGSLSLNENVFVNGGLKTGKDLLEQYKENHILTQEKNGLNLYDTNSWTLSLSEKGKLEKTKCFLYTLPYDDEIVNIKTATGREIKVTKNHPFLVNDKGEIKWRKAEHLSMDDYIVHPKNLSFKNSTVELKSHQETIEDLKKEFKVATRKDLINLKKKTNNFQNFSNLTGKDFDKLRIASSLTKHGLFKKLNLEEKYYWQLTRYLFKDTKNNFIKSRLSIFFHNFKIKKGDFIDGKRITRIKSFETNEDVASWIAFILSDGSISKSSVHATQKNHPKELERFIKTTEKIGVDYKKYERKDITYISIFSRPLVEYIRIRFGLDYKNKTIPYWFLSLPSNFLKSFLRTFILLESHLDEKRKRIIFSQVSKNNVNMISYMLLRENIIPYIKDQKKIYRIKIQGEDYVKYLERIGWPGKAKENPIYYSVFRIVPVNRDMIIKLIKLLGLDSFHTYKDRSSLSKKQWYQAYKAIKNGKTKVSVFMLKNLIKDLRLEINQRLGIDIESEIENNPRNIAVKCGLSITEIAEKTGTNKNKIWSIYESGYGTIQVSPLKSFIIQEFKTRIHEAQEIIQYLEGLVSGDVFYDKIKEIRYQDYNGLVFGLTVPEWQNYIGGFGSFGINHNTYVLNQAQTDRFMFKIIVGYPDFEEENIIVEKMAGEKKSPQIKKVISSKRLQEIQEIARKIPIANDIREYAIRIVEKSRNHKLIEHGASPRASINIVLAAKAKALIEGRSFVSERDIQSVAYPILRHRILLSFEAEKEGKKPDDVVRELL